MANEAKIVARVADLLATDQEERTIPFYDSRISAGTGFENPGQIFSERRIDLHTHVVRDKESTFIVEVEGESMKDAGILHKSLVVVDRSIEAKSGCIVLAVVNDKFLVKFFQKRNGQMWLVPANASFKTLLIDESHNFYVWGVVTWTLTNAINIFQLCSLLSTATTSTSLVSESSARIWQVSR